MPIRLAPIAAAAALVTPMALAQPAAHIRTTLKAVVFEGVSPPYQKTEPGYEVFGVDVLEQIRTQSDLRKVENNSVDCMKEGLNAVMIGKVESETNSCRHGTKILVQVLLQPFEKATVRSRLAALETSPTAKALMSSLSGPGASLRKLMSCRIHWGGVRRASPNGRSATTEMRVGPGPISDPFASSPASRT